MPGHTDRGRDQRRWARPAGATAGSLAVLVLLATAALASAARTVGRQTPLTPAARRAAAANVQAWPAAVAVTARASANRVVPPFLFHLVESAAGPGRILLTAFTIEPFFGA